MNINNEQPTQNEIILALVNEFGQTELLIAIQKIITELKKRLDLLKDLYTRISRTNNPNEILELLTNGILVQHYGLKYLVKKPDDKNWHANILLVITHELYHYGNLWEYLDGEFGDSQIYKIPGDDKYALNKLMSIHSLEILELIKKTIIGERLTPI